MFYSAKLCRTFVPIAVVALTSLAASPSALAQAKLLVTEIHYHPDDTATEENREFAREVGFVCRSVPAWPKTAISGHHAAVACAPGHVLTALHGHSR